MKISLMEHCGRQQPLALFRIIRPQIVSPSFTTPDEAQRFLLGRLGVKLPTRLGKPE